MIRKSDEYIRWQGGGGGALGSRIRRLLRDRVESVLAHLTPPKWHSGSARPRVHFRMALDFLGDPARRPFSFSDNM